MEGAASRSPVMMIHGAWLLAAEGWEEIAGAIDNWIANVPQRTAVSTTEA